MSKQIKVLGTGCPKCKTTYNNVLEALKQLGMVANVTKIEDIEEMMKYNVLTTPVLMIDDVMKVKGRIAQIDEIKELLKTTNAVSEENDSSCCSDSSCC